MTPCLRRLLRLLVHAWALRHATPVIAAGWRQVAYEQGRAIDRWQARSAEAEAAAETWMARFTLVYQFADHEQVDPWLDTLDDVRGLEELVEVEG